MPKFSKSDFVGENVQRLSVICMEAIGEAPLQWFRNLVPIKQKKFNKVLNEYIESLPDEEWEEKIKKDFNDIVYERCFENPKWRAEDLGGFLINTDLVEVPKNYTPEQKAEMEEYTLRMAKTAVPLATE